MEPVDDASAARRRTVAAGAETTVAVAEAVAEVTGEPPTSTPPLFEVVDPDALDRLFAPRSAGLVDGRVVFPVADCWVTVHAAGRVAVSPPTAGPPGHAAPPDGAPRAHHEWGGSRDVCVSVLALASVSGRDAANLRAPLCEAVDTDALDQIFEPIDDRRRRDAGWLSLDYEARTVTVAASGAVTLSARSSTRSDAE
jgi:hypothetical protein